MPSAIRLLFISFIIILICYTKSDAQTYNVSGVVYKSDSNIAVDAEVYLKGTGYLTFTNESGYFTIEKVPAGAFILIINVKESMILTDTLHVTNHDLYKKYYVDTVIHQMNVIEINATNQETFGISRLGDVEGAAIYAGKKTEVIEMKDVIANTATNNARQVFSRIAGLNIFENDGAGVQLGIGGRGLNPNRVSNFNTRQNGYDISADALGYPESYYTPPTEALDKIEIVRGAASLQYGTQFGGFINFKFKKPPTDKKFSLLTRQTYGSFGLFNSYNQMSGTIKKWSYFSFVQYKKSNGWRPNSALNLYGSHISVTYTANKRFSITGEYTFQYYLSQLPGGLTDNEFYTNPRMSVRNSDWFRVNWNLFALMSEYKFNKRTLLNFRSFCLIAGRDALGLLDDINEVENPTENRNLLSDRYRNFGGEVRLLHHYEFLKKKSTILVGSRYYEGLTYRKQGDANTGTGANFSFIHPDTLQSNYKFPSRNLAIFAENIFYLSSRLSVTPGVRFEYISTQSIGYYNQQQLDLAGNIVYDTVVQDNRIRNRHFVLFGLGVSYDISPAVKFYANLSQNYRAINFNDMRINNPNLLVNPNLKDEKGYSSDAGFRGNWKRIIDFDVNLFLMSYQDRIGTVLQTNTLGQVYQYRTNISNSKTIGFEGFAEIDFWRLIAGENTKTRLSWFNNLGLIDARYISSQESAFNNKFVEYVPPINYRTGLTFKHKSFRMSGQYSYMAQQYADATNTVIPTPNALFGAIPAYYVVDFSMEYRFKNSSISTGVNNATNNYYFTRRADGYPGPGIIPSTGRNFYITLQVQL